MKQVLLFIICAVSAMVKADDVSQLYNKTNPSAVLIVASGLNRVAFESANWPPIGQGSGVIIHPGGYILTNFHVVEKHNKFTAHFSNADTIEASLVGSDPESDIAILKLAPKSARTFSFLKFSNKDVQIGDRVFALGSPSRLKNSFTEGRVTGLNRALSNKDHLILNSIQHSAIISPGSSGGPLLNVNGDIIGLNSQTLIAGSGTYTGHGFALPSKLLKLVSDEIITMKKVIHPELGITVAPIAPAYFANMNSFNPKPNLDHGVIVTRVKKGSSAEKIKLFGTDAAILIGMRRHYSFGTIIYRVDNFDIYTVADLKAYIFQKRIGDTITLYYLMPTLQVGTKKLTLETPIERQIAGEI